MNNLQCTLINTFNKNISFQIALAGTTFFVGMVAGGVIFGRISDTFGRKIALIIGIFLCAVAQLAGGFSKNYVTYVIFRFIAGVGRHSN